MADAFGYVPITKQYKTSEGTLVIEGPATDSSIDLDYQIADPAWLDKAMPEWFASGANIREQHDGKRVAGVATTYEKRDDGAHWIKAEILDPVTILKIEKKALRGFSFGAREAEVVVDKAAKGGRITKGRINEVSVVDRPCNPGMMFSIAKADSSGDLQPVEDPELVETDKADTEPEQKYTPTQFAELLKSLGKTPAEPVKFTMPTAEDRAKVDAIHAAVDLEKRDFSKDERDAAAKDGSALKDGSFVIKTAADLKNAIGLVGNADDPKKAKAHVIKRARALGLVDKLPDAWGITKADQILADIGKLVPGALVKADGDAFDPDAEATDVDAGTSAIAAIARLIISEAEGLAAGRMEEIWDIQTLVDAACALQCFVSNERYQEVALMSDADKADQATTQTGTGPATTTTKADDTPVVEPETTKTDAAPAVEPKTEAAPEGELTKSDMSDLLQDAITKATQPFQERVTALEGELAKVLSTPQPGGPARTRTTTHTAIAADADRLRTEIAHCEKSIQNTGGDLQKGYRTRLDEAKAELAKLDGAA